MAAIGDCPEAPAWALRASASGAAGACAQVFTEVVRDPGGCDAATLGAGTRDAFLRAFARLRTSAWPTPARVWAFLPNIHERVGEDSNRYEVFNAGRFEAFVQMLGSAERFAGALPAASCVGHFGRHLVVHAMGVTGAVEHVENPRQVPAIEYSRKFGPRPPCFARGTVAEFGGVRRLVISGTASVRGEDSAHGADLAEQLRETAANLAAVVQAANARGGAVVGRGVGWFAEGEFESLRVYVPRGVEEDAVRAGVERVGPPLRAAEPVEFVRAEVCRAELLVEIEGTVVAR
ncbi:hypothetical protein BH11PLA1_BH11PLA1_00810 [soil metagenome]